VTVFGVGVIVCLAGGLFAQPQDRPKSLHDAARAGDLAQLQQYIEKKANLNATDNYGYTPLKCAVESYHLDAVKLLLQGGANPNTKDSGGATPLMQATMMGQKEIVEALLAGKADVAAKDKSGRMVLHTAVQMGHIEIVELLIKAGADVNATDQGGQTPLGIAQMRNQPEIAEILKKHGGTAPTLQDRYALYGDYGGGAAQSAAPTTPQSRRPDDFEIDPNVIREQLKKVPDLDVPLKAVDAKSESEQRTWIMRRSDNRTMMLRAVQDQFQEEMALVKKLAAEEKATKTSKAVDDLTAARKTRYDLIGVQLRDQRRQTMLENRESAAATGGRGGRGGRGGMTGGMTGGTTGRGGGRAGRSSTMNSGDPYGAPATQGRASRRSTAMPEAEEQPPIDADTQGQISAWLNAKPEDKANLIKAVHDLDIIEYAALHVLAVEEKAVKTDAAVMALLMQRQERIAKVQQKWVEDDERMQRMQERTGTTGTMQGTQPGMPGTTQRGMRGRGGRM
jgi:hypothetical protein